MNEHAYREMMDRIQKMENMYNQLGTAMQSAPEQIKKNPALIESAQTLCRYYNEGKWLHDYEADEKGLLPQDLKRGVLSQDGLYDLLSQLTNYTKDKSGYDEKP